MRCQVSGRECPTLDEHHVIPREYGGIDGPTVMLDPAIHQAIHRYTHNSQKLAKFLAEYPAEVRGHIQMLVTAIKEAERTLDKAQSYTFSITLDKVSYEKLEALAGYSNMSINQTAKKMLQNLLSN